MAETHPIVDGIGGAGPMEEGDLRHRLRMGLLPIDTQIRHPDWTGDSFFTGRSNPSIAR